MGSTSSVIGLKNLLRLLICIILSIFLVGLETLSLAMIMPLMDLILNQNEGNMFLYSFMKNLNYEHLYSLDNILIVFITIYFLKTVFSIFIIFFNMDCFLKIAFFTKQKMLNKYLNMSYIKYLGKNYSELLVNVNQTTNIFAYNFISSIISIFSELFLFTLIVTLLLFHDFEKTVFLMSMFLLFSIIYFFLTHQKIRVMGKNAVKLSQLATRYLNEFFKGLKFIKINSKVDLYTGQIHSVLLNNLKNERNLNFLQTLPRISLEFVTIFLFTVLVLFFKDDDDLKFVSIMALYAVAAIKLVPSVPKILQAFQNYKFGKESFEVLKSILIDNKENRIFKDYNQISLTAFNEKIILKDVSFSYGDNTKEVFQKFNLEINKGEKLIIMGTSGSGKSTLIDIILGLLKPNSGQIIIDNNDLSNTKYDLNNVIGYVPQQTFLFDDSIEKNISLEFNESKINYLNLKKALNFAKLTKFVEDKESKFKSFIGDDGSQISGGQKQRISIARAIYKDPQIIIFDEATNNLDEKTEIEIINEILKLKEKTIIFITHNKNLIKYFDKVLDLNEKNINDICH